MSCKWCKLYNLYDSEGNMMIFRDMLVIVSESGGRLFATGRNCMTPSPHERSWITTKLVVAARRKWGQNWWKKGSFGSSGHYYIEAGPLPGTSVKARDKVDAVQRKAKEGALADV